jgi:hypothetical protein
MDADPKKPHSRSSDTILIGLMITVGITDVSDCHCRHQRRAARGVVQHITFHLLQKQWSLLSNTPWAALLQPTNVNGERETGRKIYKMAISLSS